MIRVIAAVRATLSVLTLTVGVPLLLAAVTGPPIPSRVPSAREWQAWSHDPLQPHFVALAVETLAWLLWASLSAAVIASIAARLPRLSRRSAYRLAAYLPRPMQGLAATILGAAAVTTTTAPALPAPAVASAADLLPHVADTGRPDATPTATDLAGITEQTPALTFTTVGATEEVGVVSQQIVVSRPVSPSKTVCIVRAGDTLFDIAASRLGDGGRWPEIFSLNRGRHFSVGGTLTDPDLIHPGWTLRLPDRQPADAKQDPAPPAPQRPDATRPTTPPPKADTAPPSATAPTAPQTTAPSPTADEGPVGPDHTRTPATSTPSADSGTAEPTGTYSGSHHDSSGSAGVSLLSGSWVEGGLALAVGTAAALVWAHRRHRYTPRPRPSADHSDIDGDLQPLPHTVTQIRRGLRRPALSVAAGPDLAAGPDPIDDRATAHTADTDPHPTHDRYPETTTEPQPTEHDPGAEPTNLRWLTRRPGLAGTGLTGPGAAAAARGFLVTGLADGGLDEPDARTHVVIPSATAIALLGTGSLPRTARLTVTATLDQALDLLETHTLHRTRLVDQHGTDTVTALRVTDPYEEPLPPILLITDAAGAQRARVVALLSQGHRLDIRGILLGDWPESTTIHVADDGATTFADPTDHHAHSVDLARVTVLDRVEALDLLGTLAESHTGLPQPPSRLHDGQAFGATVPESSTEEPAPGPRGRGDEAAVAGAAQQGGTVDDVLATKAGTPTAAATTTTASSRPGRVEVDVLGGARIVDADPRRTLRLKSMELLVYLAANDGSATVDAILEDLLPDAPRSRAGHRLHTYISDLRGVLRHTAGPGEYLTHPRGRYTLNPATITVDLWQLRAAITEAATADPADRIAALRRAVTAYRGALADGHDYLWIEPCREATRRQALDATTALVDALTDQPEEQLAILTPAIGLHPYTERLYQAAMRAHAQLGHLDDIRALRRAVTAAAAELDVEPDDDTLALADRLAADLQTRAGRAPLPPGPGGAA